MEAGPSRSPKRIQNQNMIGNAISNSGNMMGINGGISSF